MKPPPKPSTPWQDFCEAVGTLLVVLMGLGLVYAIFLAVETGKP